MVQVREIMDPDPATVAPETRVEELLAVLREHELPGVPVVDRDGRCTGIVTEADLVLRDDQGNLHLPHYVNLFGGTVFLELLGRHEQQLRDAFASTAPGDMMTREPDTVAPDASAKEAARLIHETGHNRLPRSGRGRAAGRPRHAPGRARRTSDVQAALAAWLLYGDGSVSGRDPEHRQRGDHEPRDQQDDQARDDRVSPDGIHDGVIQACAGV